MKDTFLILDTDFSGQFKKAEIKEGKVTIDNKEWYVDKARPIKIKGFAPRSLYILTWDNVVPFEFDVEEKTTTLKDEKTGQTFTLNEKKLVPMSDLKFQEKYKQLPEILKDTQDMRFLKSMKRYAGGEGAFAGKSGKIITFVLLAVIAAAAVGLIVYAMQSGWIKF